MCKCNATMDWSNPASLLLSRASDSLSALLAAYKYKLFCHSSSTQLS